MKFKIFVATVSCLFLTACNDREGTLSAYQTLTLNTEDGRMQIPAGTYRAELEGKSGNKVELEIKSGDQKFETEFTIPENEMRAGDIFIDSSRSGLGYDISGRRDVTTSESQVRRTTQSCYVNDHGYPGRDPRCYYDPYHPFCDPIYNRMGRQDVEYIDVTTTDALALDLLSGSQKVAHFHSTETTTSRRILRMGTCW